MAIDHAVPAYTDKAAPLVEEFGGKMGGLEFMRRHDPALAAMILPAAIVKPGQDMPDQAVLRSLAKDGKAIVRGSHCTDMQGMVDVFRTSVVASVSGFASAIQQIRAEAVSDEVTAYGKYENPSYDGQSLVVGVQPCMPGIRGSIVDHPNMDGKYVVSLVNEKPWGSDYYTYLFDQDGKRLHTFCGLDRPALRTNILIQIHQRIRKLGIFPDDISFQVEFSDDPKYPNPYIFQIRAFIHRQIANFKIEGPQRRANTEKLCFGLTPEEGLVLPVVHIRDGMDFDPSIDAQGGWAAVKTFHGKAKKGRNPVLTFRPKNMQAYLPSTSFNQTGGNGKPGLEHNHYALAQKAQVTVMENVLDGEYDALLGKGAGSLSPEVSTGVNVRVVCDGVRNIVEMVA